MIVDELKKSILNSAIKGELILSGNDSANVLFDEINQTRKELIKCGKVKNKQLLDIDLEEIPFTLPKNWKWVRLNNIFNFVDYRGKTPNKVGSGIRLIGSANIKMGMLDFSKEDKYITIKEYNERKSRGITKLNDILFVTEGGSMGNVCLNSYDGECSCGQRVITLQQYKDKTLNNKFYMYVIMSSYFQKKLKDKSTGSAATGIKGDVLKSFLIPLPPLEEQNLIVEYIDKLFVKLDEISYIENELDDINKSFPYKILKSILAYYYKESEESCEKKELSDVVELLNTKTSSNLELNYLDVRYLRTGINPQKKKKGKFIEKDKYAILVDGENSGELFKMPENGYLGSTFKEVQISESIDKKYFEYYLKLKKEYFKDNKRGAAIPHLNKKIFFSSKIYVPSLTEQQRIVVKIEQLVSLCENIGKLINS